MKFSTRMKGRIPEKVVEYLLAEPVVVTGGSQLSSDGSLECVDRAQVLKSAESAEKSVQPSWEGSQFWAKQFAKFLLRQIYCSPPVFMS